MSISLCAFEMNFLPPPIAEWGPASFHADASPPGLLERPTRSARGECAPGPGISCRAYVMIDVLSGGAERLLMPDVLASKRPLRCDHFGSAQPAAGASGL